MSATNTSSAKAEYFNLTVKGLGTSVMYVRLTIRMARSFAA
ncbi:Uncharacterised protein [Escherichia coli]|uniref:Uncharacterized protein n=1 Tax=Escherichia coli TaxID=562 RepID=A0A376KJ50_ECOLX|nr:Uncharacterised protein [Escherichia coli]